jgi:predicted ATP-grasp superfamily ATP-dependent carboligase
LLASSARDAGLPAPALAEKPGAGRWLVKPRGGAGGIGIHRYEGSLPRGCYLQEFVPGLSFSAVYVGLAGSCQLLGVTRQLVGEPFVHAPTFRYCGSIGPVKLDDASEKKIKDLGNILVLRAGLHGLFGVDGIWNEGGFWPVELNPRYTASIEVLEYATGIRTLALQRHAFEGGTLPSFDRRERPVIVGKAILYTRADVCIPEQVPVAGSSETIPAFADLPYPGDSIEAGRPVLSLFATGQDIEDCLHALHDRAAGVEAWLYAGG